MSDVRQRGVYGYVCDGQLLYVGSSGCNLSTLEHNHRNWATKYGIQGRTFFRSQITDDMYRHGQFVWLMPPKPRSAEDVEYLEGTLIRMLEPPFNIDKDPVASSKKYGRY